MLKNLFSSLFDKGNGILISFGLGLSNDGSDLLLLLDFSEFSVSVESENSVIPKSNKISEPSLDKPNPKDMKGTLHLSKSDDHSFSNMSRLSQEDYKIPKKKKPKTIPEPLVTAPEVTQDLYDMEKGDKVGSSIEGSKQTSVCVTPLLSLKTPPKYTNKR